MNTNNLQQLIDFADSEAENAKTNEAEGIYTGMSLAFRFVLEHENNIAELVEWLASESLCLPKKRKAPATAATVSKAHK